MLTTLRLGLAQSPSGFDELSWKWRTDYEGLGYVGTSRSPQLWQEGAKTTMLVFRAYSPHLELDHVTGSTSHVLKIWLLNCIEPSKNVAGRELSFRKSLEQSYSWKRELPPVHSLLDLFCAETGWWTLRETCRPSLDVSCGLDSAGAWLLLWLPCYRKSPWVQSAVRSPEQDAKSENQFHSPRSGH